MSLLIDPYLFDAGVDAAMVRGLLAKLWAWYDFEDNANDSWGCFPLTFNTSNVGEYRDALTGGPGVGGRALLNAQIRTREVFPNFSGKAFGVGGLLSQGGWVTRNVFGASSPNSGGEGLVLFSESGGLFGGQARSGPAAYNVYPTAAGQPTNTWGLTLVEHRASGALYGYSNGGPTPVINTSKPNGATNDTRILHIANPNGDGVSSSALIAMTLVWEGALTTDEVAYLWNGGAGRNLSGVLADAGYTPPAARMENPSAGIALSYNGRRFARSTAPAFDTGRCLCNTAPAGKRWVALRFHRVNTEGMYYLDIDVTDRVSQSALLRFYPNVVRLPGSGVTTGADHSFSPLVTGDIVMLAIDQDTQRVWVGKNGTWSGSPAAGTGWQFDFSSGVGLKFQVELSGDAMCEVLMDPGEMPYADPAGFQAWGA